MDRAEAGRLWGEVVANLATLRGCKRHRFAPLEPLPAGRRVVCENCGGWMDPVAVLHYADGYVAAGGDRGDVIRAAPKGGADGG